MNKKNEMSVNLMILMDIRPLEINVSEPIICALKFVKIQMDKVIFFKKENAGIK